MEKIRTFQEWCEELDESTKPTREWAAIVHQEAEQPEEQRYTLHNIQHVQRMLEVSMKQCMRVMTKDAQDILDELALKPRLFAKATTNLMREYFSQLYANAVPQFTAIYRKHMAQLRSIDPAEEECINASMERCLFTFLAEQKRCEPTGDTERQRIERFYAIHSMEAQRRVHAWGKVIEHKTILEEPSIQRLLQQDIGIRLEKRLTNVNGRATMGPEELQ